MIKERIKKLQNLMKEHQIDIYIIPTSDYHQSEYVGRYFACREYMSGFTGSAGTLIVTLDQSYLWVDGRYYLQAQKEIEGTDIILMKDGMEGVEKISQFLSRHKDQVIGFDGKVMSQASVAHLPNIIVASHDLVGEIWNERPTLSCQKAFDYDIKYCGESRVSKLKRLREKMKDSDYHIMTTLDDIVWLFNIRGNDVPCNPVVNSYALISQEHAYLYVLDGVIDETLKDLLLQDGITIKSYNEIYDDVKTLKGKIMLDSATVNYSIYQELSHCIIEDVENPTQLFKAVKNEIEIKNTKDAHLKDGVAMTKFMYWLKNEDKSQLTEFDIQEKLANFRRQQDLFYDLSFSTICAYQANGASMHYKTSETHSPQVDNKGLLLIDSGGQYYDGTTDITRTFVLGPISDEQSHDFTVALKAMFRLQNAHFPQGTNGMNLDILARGIVYDEDLDYRCGTGHGVGHFLNVHEGPNSIRPSSKVGQNTSQAILPGMITTDEPGIYKDGKYGIRHENELLCVKGQHNEYGQFLHFECLTYCPFDIDGLDLSLLNQNDIQTINDYQKHVYDAIKDELSSQEKEWYQSSCYIK